MKFAENQKILRLAIFFFFDKDGIIDDYIPYMLNDLNKNISELLVVCNGYLSDEGKEKLKKITSNIIERENKGFDVWAYKTGLEYYGWEKLSQFDEVILLNFTMFGPLYPFVEMFNKMDTRDVDFWGITKHHEVNHDAFGTCKYGYIPEHIQSSFLVIRKSLLSSTAYQEFWDTMPMINSYADSVGYYEAIFTKDFKNKGYKEEVYVNTEDLRDYTRYPLLMMSYELVKNRRCPVIKRKSFSQSYYDMLSETVGAATLELYDYIRHNLNYDVSLIWDNILRTCNMADIKNIMHLNYILPSKCLLNQCKSNKKVALVIHIYFEDQIDYCYKYAFSMPSDADIFITTDTTYKKLLIEAKFKSIACNKIQVNVIENRGRDVSALLVATKSFIMNYDYVCFAHDKKTTQIKPYCIGEGFSYKCFENILGTEYFVENVIKTFEDNPKLGLLTPPPPHHASFYQTLYSTWANNYDNVMELAKKLGLNVPIYWDNEPIAPLGTMFWFRPKAMRKLFNVNWQYNDFPQEPNNNDGTLLHAIERIYPYVVQDEGFYVGWLINDKFSKIETTNLFFLLRESVKSANNHNNDFARIASANNDLIINLPLRYIIKIKLKKITPEFLWGFMKNIYYSLNSNK